MNKKKENVLNFHGIGGLKGWDGLFWGVKWLFFSSLGRILSSVMSCPSLNASNPLGGPKTHPYPSKSFQNPFF